MSDPAVSNAQAEIEDVFGMVQTVMGDTFSVEELLTFVRLFRRRPLYFRAFRTPPEWNNLEWRGMCFAAADQDVILVQADQGDLLFYDTLGHESGHLLANHVRTLDLTLEQLIHNPDEILRQFHLSEHKTPLDEIESVADELGIRFAECLMRHACLMPDVSLELYGID
jgi:hypothetical protein